MISPSLTQTQQNPVRDLYGWIVMYPDGIVVSEQDTQEGLPFAAVAHTPVSSVALVQGSPQRKIRHMVQVPLGAAPIFFRRRRLILDPEVRMVSGGGTTHCIGWQRDTGEATYLFVFADGGTLLTDNLNAV